MRFLGRSTLGHCARNLSVFIGQSSSQLVEALGKKFAPAERLELYKAEFQIRQHVTGEKLRELMASLSKMARKAFPGAS